MMADFIPPEKQDVFYGKQSHREFCDLCDKHGIPEDKRLEFAEKMGVGFGYAYMCELLETSASYSVRGMLEDSDGKFNRYDEALQLAQQRLGEKLIASMTQYLLKRNGRVDCWPSPVYSGLLSVPLISKNRERYYDEEEEDWVVKNEEYVSDHIEVPFNYFGGEYTQHVKTTSKTSSDKVSESTTTNSVWSIEQKPGAYYRQYHYFLDSSEEYKALNLKQHSLSWKYKEAREKKGTQRKNNAKLAVVYFPVAVTVLFTLLALFWSFTNTDGLDAAINKVSLFAWLNKAAQGDGIMKIIAFIPAIFIDIAAVCWYLLTLIGSLFKIEKITVILGMALLICGGFLVSGMLDDFIKPKHDKAITRKEWREARNAKKEEKEIANSPRYKQLNAEHLKLVCEHEEYARTWTKSWFEAWKANIE